MRLINPVNEKEFGDKLTALVVLDLDPDVAIKRKTRKLGQDNNPFGEPVEEKPVTLEDVGTSAVNTLA
jgi:hypothetical protein